MEIESPDDGEISIITILTTIVRNLWTIILFGFVGGVIALALAWQLPVLFTARATFSAQGSAPPSALAGLAGQLGLSAPSSGGGGSPAYYSMLMQSPVLLSRVIDDTMVVAAKGNRRMTFSQLFQIKGRDSVEQQERAMNAYKAMVNVETQRGTGFIQVSVSSAWPDVAVQMVQSIVRAVDQYNRDTRRSQAAIEREFIEHRIAEAAVDLREAESRMQRFLAANREVPAASPLAFERDGLSRAIQLKNQVYVTLATSYEDARIREVRDTPVINVIEPARAKYDPEPRHRVKRTLIGALIGGLVGLVVLLLVDAVRRLAALRPEETRELRRAFAQTVGWLLRPFRRA
jgi:uncharacterized protein involved in exopolysaccharide biosynthesis